MGETGALLVVTPSQLSPSKLTAKTTPVLADLVRIADTEDSNSAKSMTIQKVIDLIPVVTIASDSEAYTGTNETKVINPKQRRPLVAILQTTRAMDAATGTVNIAHGLGYTPSYISICGTFATATSLNDGFPSTSSGYSD